MEGVQGIPAAVRAVDAGASPEDVATAMTAAAYEAVFRLLFLLSAEHAEEGDGSFSTGWAVVAADLLGTGVAVPDAGNLSSSCTKTCSPQTPRARRAKTSSAERVSPGRRPQLPPWGTSARALHADTDEEWPMTTRSQGVLVISADGEVMAFRDAGIAASYMEAVDVRDGEYEAFFTIGGDVLQPSVRPDDEIWVELIETGTNDMGRLKRRLAELQQRNGLVSDPDDPRAVANEPLAIEWSLRWPKRPLARSSSPWRGTRQDLNALLCRGSKRL